jgi:hypothetical protein
MGGEVLTLQFGSYANYVGAHYWNFQVNSGNVMYDADHLMQTPDEMTW